MTVRLYGANPAHHVYGDGQVTRCGIRVGVRRGETPRIRRGEPSEVTCEQCRRGDIVDSIEAMVGE